VNERSLRLFWFLAFGITWGAGGLGILVAAVHSSASFTASNPLYFLAGWGPTLAGVIVTWRRSGWIGLRLLLRRTWPTRAGLTWYFAVVVGYPAFLVAAGQLAAPDRLLSLASLPRLLPLLAVTLLRDTGPLGEEPGWRGVALPGLLQRRSPVTASLVLGCIWGVWHLPAFFISSLSQSHLSLPLFLLGTVSLSLIMTWLYVRTQGDLLLMILVHLVTNFAVNAQLVSFATQVAGEAVVAGLLLAFGGLRTERSLRR
jgi:membrane protease YdiL (CAAX protease family)